MQVGLHNQSVKDVVDAYRCILEHWCRFKRLPYRKVLLIQKPQTEDVRSITADERIICAVQPQCNLAA
jgi:hypothetical protein